MNIQSQQDFDDFKRRVIIALVVIAIGCAIGIWQSRVAAEDARTAATDSQSALNSFVVESRGRRDESCTISEREHLNDVKALRKTYEYLDALKPQEVGNTINQFIIANLNQTEENARVDVAPEYCDEPHIGLPEPDPTLPKRRDFSNLLIQK